MPTFELETNAKSILSLLVTGVRQNDRIEIQAEGTDESPAVEALEELVRSDFAQ
jgi:phosphotransferase system HPr (HPr) family protein